MIWLLLIGGINLFLLIFSLLFLMPKGAYKKIPLNPKVLVGLFLENIKPILIIIGVVAFHLIEVKFIDPAVTQWVDYDFANTLVRFEDGAVYWFSQHWNPILLRYFVLIYIVIYTFTLWFSPLYFIIGRKKRALKWRYFPTISYKKPCNIPKNT